MKYSLLLQASTPIAHGDTLSGIDNNSNIRLFMRQQMIVNGIATRIPCISENSLRTVIWRKTLANHLVASTNVTTLPKTVVNLLYSGGNLMSGAKAPAGELSLGRDLHKHYPSLELLSGAVDNFVLPEGKLRPCAWLVTSEYLPMLRKVAPTEVCQEAENISVFDLIAEETRTRGTGAESEGNQMLYGYETLAAGAQVYMQVDIAHGASELCHSAAGFAIEAWDGFIGGQSRQGRGLMSVKSHDLPSGDVYKSYIQENSEFLASGLESGKFGTEVVLCGGK